MSKRKTPLDELAELLKNPSHKLSVEVYTENEGGCKPVKKHKQEKVTLAKLAEEMRSGFKQVNSRIDSLATNVKTINTRLDYIVKANNLKDLPNN